MTILKNALYVGCVAGVCSALTFGLVACGDSGNGSASEEQEEILSSSSAKIDNEADDDLESSSSVRASSSSEEVDFEEFNPAISYSDFKDSRDNKRYKTVTIGNQLWMAENLNYKSSYSFCYDDKTDNCEDYGALYYWGDAQDVCPDGWHLPSKDEWQELFDAVGSDPGKKLKATFSWDDDGNGTDKYGFRVLASGYKKGNEFLEQDDYASFWSSDEFDLKNAISWRFTSTDGGVRKNTLEKSIYRSVRCVNDRSVNSKYDVEVMTSSDLSKYACSEKTKGQTAYIKDVEQELICAYDYDLEDYMWMDEEDITLPSSSSSDDDDDGDDDLSSSSALPSSSSTLPSSSSVTPASSSGDSGSYDLMLDEVDDLGVYACDEDMEGTTAYIADLDVVVVCTYDEDLEYYDWFDYSAP